MKKILRLVACAFIVATIGCSGKGSGGGGENGSPSEPDPVVPEKKHSVTASKTVDGKSKLAILPGVTGGQIVNLVRNGQSVAISESRARDVCWGGQCATWPGVPGGTGICVPYQSGKAALITVKNRDDGLAYVIDVDGVPFGFNKDFVDLFADEGMEIKINGEHIRYAPSGFNLDVALFTCDTSGQPPPPEPVPETHHVMTVHTDTIDIVLAIEENSLVGLASNPVPSSDVAKVCWFGDSVWAVREDLCAIPVKADGRTQVTLNLPIGFQRGMPFALLEGGSTVAFNTSWIDAGEGGRPFHRDADGVLVIDP